MSIDLYNDDCLEKMKDIPDGHIDAIICDPPYGITCNKWDVVIPFEPMWEQLNRIIKPNGAIVLFGKNKFSFKLGLSNEDMYRYTIIWQKTMAVGFMNANKMPLQSHEDILVFYKNLPTYNPQLLEGKPYIKKYINNEKKLNFSLYSFRFDSLHLI